MDDEFLDNKKLIIGRWSGDDWTNQKEEMEEWRLVFWEKLKQKVQDRPTDLTEFFFLLFLLLFYLSSEKQVAQGDAATLQVSRELREGRRETHDRVERRRRKQTDQQSNRVGSVIALTENQLQSFVALAAPAVANWLEIIFLFLKKIE